MQTDGNLVLYQNNQGVWRAVWNTGTFGKGGTHLLMQTDGNLVIYTASNVAVWSTGTGGHEPNEYHVDLQNDGNVVLYTGSGQVLWNTQTVFMSVSRTSTPLGASITTKSITPCPPGTNHVDISFYDSPSTIPTALWFYDSNSTLGSGIPFQAGTRPTTFSAATGVWSDTNDSFRLSQLPPGSSGPAPGAAVFSAQCWPFSTDTGTPLMTYDWAPFTVK
jgi:hypothetical protein